MTIVQKQRQLYFFGYYKGKIDGIWGYQSKAATKKFQADNGLEGDGIFGALTEKKSIEIVVGIQKAVGAVVDGLAGSETMAKTKAYQKKHGLTADGIAGELTRAKIFGKKENQTSENEISNKEAVGGWWVDIKHFNRSEFACKCGGKYCNGFPVEPSRELVELLDKVRAHYGEPVRVSSGIRCTRHNANCGGATQSQHLRGTAADIRVDGVSPTELYNYLCSIMPNSGGIGKYSWGCHVDVREQKARWNG